MKILQILFKERGFESETTKSYNQLNSNDKEKLELIAEKQKVELKQLKFDTKNDIFSVTSTLDGFLSNGYFEGYKNEKIKIAVLERNVIEYESILNEYYGK